MSEALRKDELIRPNFYFNPPASRSLASYVVQAGNPTSLIYPERPSNMAW